MENTIRLDEIYFIETDSYNWTLKYAEAKTRVVDGLQKEYIATDEWHYPNIKLCLKKYIDQSLKHEKNVDALMDKLESLETRINNLEFSFA